MTTTVGDLTAKSGSVAPPAKPHTSHSGRTTLIRCGKAYQLKRVLNLPGDPGYPRAGGSAVHAATEAYDRQRFAELGR